MAGGDLLSKTDQIAIRLLFDRFYSERQNVNKPTNSDDGFLPPEVYVAKPPSTGIPALTRIGSGPAAGDQPGYADCEIYRVNDFGTGEPELEAMPLADKRVYNVSSSGISGSQQWVVVHRTKDGKWVAAVSATTSSPSLVGGICGCYCLSSGDITVGGYESTSQWSVVLPELRVDETYGYVVLPANLHDLVYDVLEDYWVKDISSELQAYYTSGNVYTITGSITATIIFRRTSTGTDANYMTLRVEWPDDLVPEETGTGTP